MSSNHSLQRTGDGRGRTVRAFAVSARAGAERAPCRAAERNR